MLKRICLEACAAAVSEVHAKSENTGSWPSSGLGDASGWRGYAYLNMEFIWRTLWCILRMRTKKNKATATIPTMAMGQKLKPPPEAGSPPPNPDDKGLSSSSIVCSSELPLSSVAPEDLDASALSAEAVLAGLLSTWADTIDCLAVEVVPWVAMRKMDIPSTKAKIAARATTT